MKPILLSADGDAMLYFILGIIGFVLSIYLARWIFSIERIVGHLRAQTVLLSHIAERSGVNRNVVRKLYFDAEGKTYSPVAENKNPNDSEQKTE